MEIALENLEMTYPSGKRALNQITMRINSPAMIGLLGPNGAGKSTLIKLMTMGLLPTKGQILLDGTPLESKEKQLRASLGYLPQSFGLYDDLSVFQFLDYMSAVKGITDNKKEINVIIEQVNLREMAKNKIRTLSGGQRQRVGIAQALLGAPNLLILDEPTVGLDPEERMEFRKLFSKLAEDKIVLLSTHIIEDIQSISNRLVVLHGGEVIFDDVSGNLIALAKNHVGIVKEDQLSDLGSDYRTTSRLDSADGIMVRIVSETLPGFAKIVEPSLEDAYIYLTARKENVL